MHPLQRPAPQVARLQTDKKNKRAPGTLEVLALVAVPRVKVVVEPHLREG